MTLCNVIFYLCAFYTNLGCLIYNHNNRQTINRLENELVIERNKQQSKEVEVESIKFGGDIEEKFQCNICHENVVNIIFTPCGHFCCEKCSIKLNECHMCRSNIHDRHKIFF